jgi:methyl-accepting chemotaxis protein
MTRAHVIKNSYTQKMGDEYDTVFRQCVSLNTELHKLVPLAKQMHLLSSNAVSSAARAGSKGDAFRVLTQDIQLLGDEVSHCIVDTQKVINEIVMLASNLARLFSSYVIYEDLLTRMSQGEVKTTQKFFERGQKNIVNDIRDNNHKLSRNLGQLSNLLSPVGILVKKGEYLAVCSSVEAASSGEYGISFEAVATMLRHLVEQLGRQAALQNSLLRDLSEAMEKQQLNQRNLLYAR